MDENTRNPTNYGNGHGMTRSSHVIEWDDDEESDQEKPGLCCLQGCLAVSSVGFSFFLALPTGILLLVLQSNNDSTVLLALGCVLVSLPALVLIIVILLCFNQHKLHKLKFWAKKKNCNVEPKSQPTSKSQNGISNKRIKPVLNPSQHTLTHKSHTQHSTDKTVAQMINKSYPYSENSFHTQASLKNDSHVPDTNTSYSLNSNHYHININNNNPSPLDKTHQYPNGKSNPYYTMDTSEPHNGSHAINSNVLINTHTHPNEDKLNTTHTNNNNRDEHVHIKMEAITASPTQLSVEIPPSPMQLQSLPAVTSTETAAAVATSATTVASEVATTTHESSTAAVNPQTEIYI